MRRETGRHAARPRPSRRASPTNRRIPAKSLMGSRGGTPSAASTSSASSARRGHLVEAERPARVGDRPGAPLPRAVVPLHEGAAVLLGGRRGPGEPHASPSIHAGTRARDRQRQRGRRGRPNGRIPVSGCAATHRQLPGSVAPRQSRCVPDHLGVDHFAAFPSEFLRRIILGWSPRGVWRAAKDAARVRPGDRRHVCKATQGPSALRPGRER